MEVKFGEPVKLTYNGGECFPFDSTAKLASDASNDAAWANFCEGVGIAGVDLGEIEVS